MAKRSVYRDSLSLKLRVVPNSIGRAEFTSQELNDLLANAPRRLFPHIYKRTEHSSTLATDSYGRMTMPNGVDAGTVTEVWDEYDCQVRGWRSRGTSKLVSLPADVSGLTIAYITPYTMPSNDDDDSGIPDQFFEMVTLQAAIMAIEATAAKKVNFRGYTPPGTPGENEILNLHESLRESLDLEIRTKGMTLPPMAV